MSHAVLLALEQEIEARGLEERYAQALVNAALGEDNDVQVFLSAIECMSWDDRQSAPSVIIAVAALTLAQRTTAAKKALESESE